MTFAAMSLSMRVRKLVGLNLRRLRVAQNLSQEALGLLSGREPSYVGRIERGEENVTIDTLEYLAKVLAVEMAAFFIAVDPKMMPTSLRPGRKRRDVSGRTK